MGKERLIHFINKWILSILILLPVAIYTQTTETNTKYQFNGSLRTRGFYQGRDIILNRQTSTSPIYDPQAEEATRQAKLIQQYNDRLQALALNKPDPVTPHKEAYNYFDARMLLNLTFSSSKYFEAVAGLQIGNTYFGGQPYAANGTTDPNRIGASSGGELGNASGVNLSTNLLYLNYKYPKAYFNFKLGIQLFSSPKGRVLYSTGAGISLSKKFTFLTSRLESGALRAREHAFIDQDYNGYNDKYNVNENVFYYDYQFRPFKRITSNLYSWYLDDNDKSNKEYGKLYWHGFYNEANYTYFSFIVHGILNDGIAYTFHPKVDNTGNYLRDNYDRHAIKGGLIDLELNLKPDEKFIIKLTGIGTTGRPGFETDGVASNSRGNGYRTLKPGFAISNIGIDFTGGYALFSASSMSGLYETGISTETIPFGSFLLTIGFYELKSTLSPKIENNRNYTKDKGYSSSDYFGKEYNLNFRWNITEDFQIMFRSGYFLAGDGYKTFADTTEGKTIKEAFVSLEHKF